MKKHFVSFFALLIAQLSIAANVTKPADIPAYYANVDHKSGSSLMTTLNTITNIGFSSLGYDGLWNAYPYTDVYPTDSVGKAGLLWDMYGGCEFPTNSKRCGNYSGECDCVNREHSIPKSWWGGGKNNMYSDVFHLLPTDGYVNNRRSNYAFGEVATATYQYNGCKLGSPKEVTTDKGTIYNTTGATCSTSPVFEPGAQYKGDFARGYLGMIASYYNSSYSITSGAGGAIFEAFKSAHFGLTQYGVVLLMKWHREDPVSQKEIDRNNGIQKTQGNRNPFIDYPYLAEYIWGEHAGEPVNLSLLMPSTDPEFVPGVSNGSRSSAVPVVPTVKYGVTYFVNGSALQTDSVAEGNQLVSLPDEPSSCSTESNVFMGWTDAVIAGVQDDAPAALYKVPADMPAVTKDITLYAVFAKETIEQGAALAVYTFSADSQEGWQNTGDSKGSYWLLDQGKQLVSPVVDLAGLSSVQAKLRTYGGTDYNQFAIAAGETVLGTITVEKGSTLTEYEWLNTHALNGSSALTFTCSNAAGNKGVGLAYVTINATGTGTSYSRYITSCQIETEVETTPVNVTAKKVLVGGQIYILVGDRLFTVMGQPLSLPNR